MTKYFCDECGLVTEDQWNRCPSKYIRSTSCMGKCLPYTDLVRMEKAGVLAPEGECKTCEERRNSVIPTIGIWPNHIASKWCESGKHAHCSCDRCF